MTKKTGTIIALTGLAAATMHIINRVEFSTTNTMNGVLEKSDIPKREAELLSCFCMISQLEAAAMNSAK